MASASRSSSASIKAWAAVRSPVRSTSVPHGIRSVTMAARRTVSAAIASSSLWKLVRIAAIGRLRVGVNGGKRRSTDLVGEVPGVPGEEEEEPDGDDPGVVGDPLERLARNQG